VVVTGILVKAIKIVTEDGSFLLVRMVFFSWAAEVMTVLCM
jgi:hypothetical protein